VARLLVVQHEPDCPPGLLGDAAAATGLDLEVVEAPGQPVPAGLDGAGGLAVLGGTMGVYDGGAFPHLEPTMALLRHAAARDVPALGICLGAQLAAHALGGRAYLGAAGMEMGWNRLRLTAAGRADPVVGQLGEPATVLLWHKDTFDLPPGAELLASGTLYPNQAFRLGSVVAIQFHPEVDAGLLAAWYADTQAPPVPEPVMRAGLADHGPAARRVLDGFCRLVAARS
jgi:GMP synthase (glutamine-hydrolysing)